MKTILRRQGNIIISTDEESLAVLRGFADGKEFIGNLHGARNIKQLRMFWALCQLVEEAEDRSRYAVKNDIMIGLGMVDWPVDRWDNVRMEPQSINCESMAQAEFDEFFKRAVAVIAGWLQVHPSDVMERYHEIMADRRFDSYIRK